MPGTVAKLDHYRGERPIFDLFGIEEELTAGAGAARRSEERRLPHHRPDRGADDHRRQHRRLRRRAQLRRHDLQDQPRGRGLDRAPAAAAQPGRHHHRGLHRHDARGPPAAVLAELRKQLARDRTRTTVSGFTQLGLVEMTRKRTRESLAHMLWRTLPHLPGPRPGEDGAQRLLRHPARDPARGAPVQPQGVPRRRQRHRGRDAARRGKRCTWPG